MDCWLLVTSVEVQPPATGAAGCDAAAQAVAVALRRSWDKRSDGASTVLITSILDEELHTVHGIDENPPLIWTRRLRKKFERRSEADAKIAFMLFLDFAHIEFETACKGAIEYERLCFSTTNHIHISAKGGMVYKH